MIFKAIDRVLDKSQNEAVEIADGDKISIINDIKYSRTKKFNAVLDVYFDAEIKTKRPVMFYIHGGGFVAGGKEYRKAIALWFAVQGYFVVNVNYGLSPECVFPEQLKHLASALNWVEKNQGKFNLDLKKIVVSGDSAGAYYAAMFACLTESEELQKNLKIKTNLHFAGTVLNCGLYDMKSVLEKRLAFGINEKIFEEYTGIKKEMVNDYEFKDCCSPLSVVNDSFPPTYLIYAEKDIFCSGQAERFAEKLDELGVYFESFCSTSPFVNHCFSLEWKSKPAQRANIIQAKFLEKIKNGEMPRKQKGTFVCIRESL